MKHTSLIIFTLLWYVPKILAETPAEARDETARITPVLVITGTRTEKPVLETPVRTEVVSREEIEKTHARDLKEALEDVPGLLLRPIHGKTGYEAWLQGLDSDRVLILIDDEPVTPSTGSTVDLSQIGTMDIERIEIVKGATSALYGSSAMGGVINVITRRPGTGPRYQISLDGGSYGDKNLSGNPGEFNTRRLAAHLAVQRAAGRLQFSADLRDRAGYRLDPDAFRSEGPTGSKRNFDLRLAWTPDSRTEIWVKPRLYREDISNKLSRFAPGTGEIRMKKNEIAERISATLGLERATDNGRLRGWILRENWSNITQQDAISTPEIEQQRTAEIDTYRAELQWDRAWGEHHALTAGLVLGEETLNQYQDRSGEARITEVDDKRRRHLEIYLQDDIFLGERWEVVPGIRVQDDSDFGFYAAPNINILFTPDWFNDVTTNVRLGVGRGYRVPNLKERYFVFDHSPLGYMIIGNDALEPERSDSYQFGIEFARPGRFRAEIHLFHNRIRELIDTDINPEQSIQRGLLIFEYRNIARALTQGMELNGQLRLGRFDLKAGYTLLDSEDRDTGKTLTERPRHQVKTGIDYRNPAWGTLFSLRGVYQSEELIDADNQVASPSWSTWDIRLTQRISGGLSVFAGIDNLTDEHRDPGSRNDFRPQTGRFIYLGIRLEGRT